MTESGIQNTTYNNQYNGQTPSPSAYPPALLAWTIWGCAALFYLYEYILRVTPSVMTEQLMGEFKVSSTALGVLSSYYYYAYVPLQIPCGMIVDYLGPRRVITVSALLCTMGSYYFAQSETLMVAELSRFIMGAGSACAYLSCTKLGADWFPPEKFALIAGVTMMMGTFGGTFGGQPFAVLVNNYGWRPSMLIAAAVGVAVTAACWLIIRDKPTRLKTATIPHNYGFLEGLKVITCLPQAWLIGIYGGLMYVPISAFAELWGVPYLMQAHGINNETASLASAMVFIGMALGSPIGAALSNRLNSRLKVMSGAALLTLILFSLVIYIPHLPLSLTFVFLFLAGFACGGQILYFACAKEITPPELSGTVIGFTNALVMVSGVIFQPLLGRVLDYVHNGALTPEGLPLYSQLSYQITLTAVPLCLLGAWVILLFVKETYFQDAQ